MAELRYWDSNCFLAWLQNEEDAADRCQDVLSLAERGEIVIVTSALAIAEVLRLRPKNPVPAERRAAVEGLFGRRYIHTIMLTRRLAEVARDLVWDHNIESKDAVHVASALAANAVVLNTFDGGLIGKSEQVGTPPLIIEPPTVVAPELDLEGSESKDQAPT